MQTKTERRFKNKWTAIPNEIINNPNISAKAKFMWLYINSKPEKWSFSISGAKAQLKEGRDAIRKALQELEGFGLLIREQEKHAGKFSKSVWYLFDTPTAFFDEKSEDVVPGVGKSDIEKQNTSNTIESKTVKSNTKKVEVPTFEVFKEYALSKEKELSEQGIFLKYEAWKENGWKTGGKKPRKIVNWKSTLLNTIPFMEKSVSSQGRTSKIDTSATDYSR